MIKTCVTYIDAHGHKVVEPMYCGSGGCASGMIYDDADVAKAA